MRIWAVASFAIAALLVPATGASAAKDCNNRAKLVSGKLSRLTDDRHFQQGAEIGRNVPFHADTDAEIRFQEVVYELRKGSEFILACFGHTVQQGAIYPRVELFKGHAKLIAKDGHPGAISTNEAMADPFADRGMRIVVSRDPRNSNPLFGVTKVDQAKGGGYVNVTPYVGPKPGTCRQVEGGTFESKRLENGYFKGSADYRGYSPTSPR